MGWAVPDLGGEPFLPVGKGGAGCLILDRSLSHLRGCVSLLPSHLEPCPGPRQRPFAPSPLLLTERQRRGVVWCALAWCGVMWCGVVWCSVVWCSVVWCTWCGAVWCGVVWCGHWQLGSTAKLNSRCSVHATPSPHTAPHHTTPRDATPRRTTPRHTTLRHST